MDFVILEFLLYNYKTVKLYLIGTVVHLKLWILFWFYLDVYR
jgi:hypothetical protein